MIKIIIYISIIIILYFCLIDDKEHFVADIYQGKRCCVIRKKRLDKNFIYTYKKSKYCDNYHDNYLRTVKEGQIISNRKFKIDNCQLPKNAKSTLFGSCRKLGGFECVDFVTKRDCKKFPGLIWSKKSCNNKIPIEINYYKNVQKELTRTSLQIE
jgi:hypothetical protein